MTLCHAGVEIIAQGVEGGEGGVLRGVLRVWQLGGSGGEGVASRPKDVGGLGDRGLSYLAWFGVVTRKTFTRRVAVGKT